MLPRLLSIADLPPHQSFFLFGARGTGKSTLIQQYLQSSHYPHLTYNLLQSEDYLRLQASPQLIRQEVREKITPNTILQVHIDEVQKVPILLDEVHDLIETYPKQIRFILSGSSARKLKRGGANLLAGRAWFRHLYPFTHLEIPQGFSLLENLRFGSLPLLYGKSDLEKQEDLKAYVRTYLQEEIQAEALTRRLDHFHRFLEIAATFNGELLNMTQIAQEAMIPRKSVAAYYQILEDTLLGFSLPSWGRRRSRKQLVTHGKFYFFDTGVVSALTQSLSAPLSPKTSLLGRYFEHFCLLEFIRIHHYKNTEHRIGFYRTHAGAEVDLVEEKGEQLRAIEIKSTEVVTKRQLSGLKSFLKKFPSAEAIVVCRAPRAFQMDEIRCVPWEEFFKGEWVS